MNATAIATALNMIQAMFKWLASRGVNRSRIQALLNEKAETGEDFTTEEIQAELNVTDSELDETERLINANFN